MNESPTKSDCGVTACVNANDDLNISQVKLIGLKKLKRSLSFSDGQNITKATIQRRKKRIQMYLGGKPKIEKCTMAVFMDKLQKMHKCESDIDATGIAIQKY